MSDREILQQRVYHYLTELRGLFAEAPVSIRSGISETVLVQLADSAAEGSIFDLVIELAEEQRQQERAQHKQLTELRSEHSEQRSVLRQKHREQIRLLSSRPHHLNIVQKQQDLEKTQLLKRQSDAIQTLTTQIVYALDGRVVAQQALLEKRTGCSAFVCTTNPQLIAIQMRLLDWIMRLSRRPLPTHLLLNSPLTSAPTNSSTTLSWTF